MQYEFIAKGFEWKIMNDAVFNVNFIVNTNKFYCLFHIVLETHSYLDKNKCHKKCILLNYYGFKRFKK